jgi:hypothetical protein
MAAERVVYTWANWWGSPDVIVRGELPRDLPHQVRRNERVIKLVKQVAELLPQAKPAELGPPAGAFRPLPLHPEWRVRTQLIQFAERYAQPEAWQRVILKGGELFVLVGLRDGDKEPVALVAASRNG